MYLAKGAVYPVALFEIGDELPSGADRRVMVIKQDILVVFHQAKRLSGSIPPEGLGNDLSVAGGIILVVN